MIVTVTDIVAKIKNLPEHYAEHVHMDRPDGKTRVCNTAKVDSFTHATKVYTVAIHVTENKGERKVVCTCDATKLCNHVVSFYAVAKGFKPDGSVKPTGITTPKPDKGTKTPSEEIEGAMPHIISMAKLIAEAVELSRKAREAAEETAEALDKLERAYTKAKTEIEK